MITWDVLVSHGICKDTQYHEFKQILTQKGMVFDHSSSSYYLIAIFKKYKK